MPSRRAAPTRASAASGPGQLISSADDYLKFAREFNLKCPGFETDIHGLVEERGDDGVKRYYADCVKN